MSIIENKNGTYIMNSKDLSTIKHLQRLVYIGVDNLQTEGRTKSDYYLACTT